MSGSSRAYISTPAKDDRMLMLTSSSDVPRERLTLSSSRTQDGSEVFQQPGRRHQGRLIVLDRRHSSEPSLTLSWMIWTGHAHVGYEQGHGNGME